MGRIIAIDYGTKRTGVAVTDPDQVIASPMETVPTHELMQFLQDYFEKEPVDLLVVGKPLKMDHSVSGPTKQILYFVDAFKKRFKNIPVRWMDERFTSSMAMDAMIEGGVKKSDRRVKGNVDRISASLILQSFLVQKNNMKA